jgi:hypothetical protein
MRAFQQGMQSRVYCSREGKTEGKNARLSNITGDSVQLQRALAIKRKSKSTLEERKKLKSRYSHWERKYTSTCISATVQSKLEETLSSSRSRKSRNVITSRRVQSVKVFGSRDGPHIYVFSSCALSEGSQCQRGVNA